MNNTSATWYCVCTHARKERSAEAALRRWGVEAVYHPRIRRPRLTKRGKEWISEPLFPGYLFVRFDPIHEFRKVRYAPGIRDILRFGSELARVSDEDVRGFERAAEAAFDGMKTGGRVILTTGALRGLHAEILRVDSGADRVRVLLEFLGHRHELDLACDDVMAA